MPFIENQDSFMTRLQELIGDRTDDVALNFVQDARDTYAEFVGRGPGGITQEQYDTDIAAERQKAADADAEWRKKYMAAFFGDVDTGIKNTDKPINPITGDGDRDNPKTFDELFN